MFCPNCGKNLPDGSRFCGTCGANLTEFAGESLDRGSENVNSTDPKVTKSRQPEFVQPKKKKRFAKLIGVAAVVVVVIIAAVAVRNLLLSGSGGSNAYAYLSDGKYELITNLKKDQTIEIASSKSDSALYSLLSFSPDGKYIYYYTKVDVSSYTGSLCRAEYGKLKENSAKNDNYIEVIATNVSLGFTFLDNGTLLYENGDATLYYYDGKDAMQIAKSVNAYYTDGSNRVVYNVGDYEDGYTLYGVSVSDIDDRIKLASNYDICYVYESTDFDNIFYTKADDDGNISLYVVGFDKDSEKIGSNVDVLSISDGVVYFTEQNGETLNLYDYVVDSYASDDAGITEPKLEDYGTPTYGYYMIYGSDLSESDYGELYTSCTKDLYWYGESIWWCDSMEEAVDEYWGDYTDGVVTATQSFIDKFADQADENGYILVTDEVKTALKEINQYGDNPENEWEWLWLCYSKEQSGTSYDYDAYYDDFDTYCEAADRIAMREVLQDKENDYAVKTLYCYNNGNLTAISEDVLSARSYSGGVMYNTTDLITSVVNLEDITSIYTVESLFSINLKEQNYLVPTTGTTVYQMSQSAADTFSESYNSNYATLYIVGTDVYMSDSDGLYVAEVSNGVVGNFSIIADEAYVYSIEDTTVYYVSGEYESSDYTYGDLYSYSKGKNTLLAQDIMLECNSILYSDGVVLAYTDYRSGYGYELTMFESDGTKSIIADDVTQYIRVDKSTLLYISDDDLYLYDGKEKTRIRSDVDYLWSQNAMETSQEFGWYY